MIGAIVLQIILIALNAIFASAEIAVISMNEIKIKKAMEQGDKRARKILRLTRTTSPLFIYNTGGYNIGRIIGKCICCRKFCWGFGECTC